MSMTVEQFLSFSESEQLQTVKELNDTGNGRATQMFEITIEHMSGKQVQEK